MNLCKYVYDVLYDNYHISDVLRYRLYHVVDVYLERHWWIKLLAHTIQHGKKHSCTSHQFDVLLRRLIQLQ